MKQILFYGNSLIAGNGSSTYSNSNPTKMTGMDLPAQFSRLMSSDYKVLNYGTPGRKTTSMVSNYNIQIAPLYSSANFTHNIIVIWEITNDLCNPPQATEEEAYQHIKSLCNMAKATGYKVVLINLMDRVQAVDSTYNAAQFLAIKQSINARLVNTYPQFADALVDADSLNLARPDGIHLNDVGYAAVANLLKPVIQNLIGETNPDPVPTTPQPRIKASMNYRIG